MPKYFDPVTQEDTLLDRTTSVYLVKISYNKYCIKGISCDLEKLSSDPTTHAGEYWPLSIDSLMNHSGNAILFEGDNLTLKPLSQEQIVEFFTFNPENTCAKQFNSAIKEELSNDWAQQMMQTESRYPILISHSFFHHAHVHSIGARNTEQNDSSILPTILLYHMTGQETSNEEELSLGFLVNILLINNRLQDIFDGENTRSLPHR